MNYSNIKAYKMVQTISNPKLSQPLQQLVDNLKQQFQTRLITIYHYGGAILEPNWQALEDTHQHANLLVIVDQLTPQDLKNVASIAQGWEKTARMLPVFMSLAEWHQSADVF